MKASQKIARNVLLGLVAASGCGFDGAPSADPPTGAAEHDALTLPRMYEGEYKTERLDLFGNGPEPVTYQLVNGHALFENDIVLDLDKLRVPEGDVSRGTGRKTESRRWTNATIPYVIDASLGGSDARIAGAMNDLVNATPLRFVPRTNEPDYVRFKFDPSTCASTSVGRTSGEITVFFDPACQKGDAIHELLHVAGLWHEQNRADRDTWIFVDFNNLNPDPNVRSQYKTYVQTGDDGFDTTSFDFQSIMLYDSFSYAINTAKPVMWRIWDKFTWSKQFTLSAGDINAVSRMYPRFPAFSADNMPTIASSFRPAITSWSRDRLDVLAIATDGSLRHQYSNNGGTTWSGWVDNWGGVVASGVSAVSWGPGRIDAVAKGLNGTVWHFYYQNGSSGWEDTGMPMKFDPGISSWSSGNLDLFCVGTDNAGKHRAYRSATGWSAWENLGGVLTTGVDAVSWGPNRIDVVSRNSWNRLARNAFITTGWSGWADEGGNLSASTPTIGSAHVVNHLDEFAEFADGNIHKRSWDNGWELNWGDAGGSTLAQPDVIEDDVGRFDVVGLSGGFVRHEKIRTN